MMRCGECQVMRLNREWILHLILWDNRKNCRKLVTWAHNRCPLHIGSKGMHTYTQIYGSAGSSQTDVSIASQGKSDTLLYSLPHLASPCTSIMVLLWCH